MKLSYAVTLACVASATLVTALPPRTRVVIVDVATNGSPPLIASRDVEDNRLVGREPRRGRGHGPTGLSTSGTVLAEGVGSLGGASASRVINGARDLSEDELLFAREPRTEATSDANTTNPRDFDEEELLALKPHPGRGRGRSHKRATDAKTVMNKKMEKEISDALDVMATRDITFVWDTGYSAVHNALTSQLGGLKPGSRRDTFEPKLYWVGLFESKNKRIIKSPLIQASFATAPDVATTVAELRKALKP